MKTKPINVKTLMKNVTLHIEIMGVKKFKIRIFIAKQLMKISALILSYDIIFEKNKG